MTAKTATPADDKTPPAKPEAVKKTLPPLMQGEFHDVNQVISGTILSCKASKGEDNFVVEVETGSQETSAVIHSVNGRKPVKGEQWQFSVSSLEKDENDNLVEPINATRAS